MNRRRVTSGWSAGFGTGLLFPGLICLLLGFKIVNLSTVFWIASAGFFAVGVVFIYWGLLDRNQKTI